MSTAILTPGALKVALAASDSAGGVVSLANPEGADVIVTRLVVYVTAAATASCTIDAGIAATATTSSDNLINGLDVNAATGVFDNITDVGTNGKSRQRWPSNYYLTISKASGATAGLAGYAYVEYIHA
mgnify:CR=1 FL=1